MCDKCQQLENRIQRYRKFIAQELDSATVERISALIQELQQRKETMQH
jgi:ABC-type phosphate transport system auxiliary subunit